MSDFSFDQTLWKNHFSSQDVRLAHNDAALWKDLFPTPSPEGNKYTRGHALIYGGPIMTGAARLAARAAQRMGAGLVTVASTDKAVPIYAEALESVIVLPLEDDRGWGNLVNNPKNTVLLIGPGLGIGEEERNFILAAIETRKPMVLDADVFTNFAGHSHILLPRLHEHCVLTPHEGEFNRLFDHLIDGVPDRLARARKAAQLAGCTLLLKGAETIIAQADGYAVVNRNAPPWLATAGAGDVLAGMILGLISQKMPAFAAAAAAAWLHGKIANDFGLGLIAEDLVAGIPKALQDLFPKT